MARAFAAPGRGPSCPEAVEDGAKPSESPVGSAGSTDGGGSDELLCTGVLGGGGRGAGDGDTAVGPDVDDDDEVSARTASWLGPKKNPPFDAPAPVITLPSPAPAAGDIRVAVVDTVPTLLTVAPSPAFASSSSGDAPTPTVSTISGRRGDSSDMPPLDGNPDGGLINDFERLIPRGDRDLMGPR